MWYRKRVSSSLKSNTWFHPENYGWFTIGIDWDSPTVIDEFQSDEEIRDAVEENCLLASSQLERAGFPRQRSSVIFSPEYVHNDTTGSEAGGSAESHYIKMPIRAIYSDDWSETLVHEWAHKYFWNMSKQAKDYFRSQYESLVKNSVEQNDSPEFLDMVREAVPEEIKEQFPEDISIWKIYVANSLHKPEMENIRKYISRSGDVPSSYATVDAEELWGECVGNYSKLSRELRQIISNVIGGSY